MVFFNPGNSAKSDPFSHAADVRRSTPATVANYTAAFGRLQGSIYFVDQTPFVEACLTELRKEKAANAAQAREIDAMKSKLTRLSADLMAARHPSQRK